MSPADHNMHHESARQLSSLETHQDSKIATPARKPVQNLSPSEAVTHHDGSEDSKSASAWRKLITLCTDSFAKITNKVSEMHVREHVGKLNTLPQP